MKAVSASAWAGRRKSAATLMTWEDAAKRIRELLDTGRYVPQSVLDNAPENERKELAEHLWYMVQDFSREAHDENLIPTILAIYNAHGGFPDNTAQIRELLKDNEDGIRAYHRGASLCRALCRESLPDALPVPPP